jgi:hypothetical protein
MIWSSKNSKIPITLLLQITPSIQALATVSATVFIFGHCQEMHVEDLASEANRRAIMKQ